VKTPNYGRGIAIIVMASAALVILGALAFYLMLAIPCAMWGGCP
jgi:hypothetical protein